MASRNQQSHAKRARELAVKEKRERKRAKKAARLAGEPWGDDADALVPGEGEGDAVVTGEGGGEGEGQNGAEATEAADGDSDVPASPTAAD